MFEDGGVYACTAVDDSEGTEVVSIRVEVRGEWTVMIITP